MSHFCIHTLETTPEDSIPLLNNARRQFGGMIPNLYGVMAESPALLEAYQTLNGIFEKTSLTMAERNIVWLAINFSNGCTYCMAAHTAVAKHSGLGEADIESMRNGTELADKKQEALRRFTNNLVENRGWPESGAVDAILTAGYNQTTILDVVLAIGLKTLSNYANHVAETPVDAMFEKYEWHQP